MTSLLLLALGTTALGASAWSLARRAWKGSAAEVALAAWAIGWTLLIVLTYLLGALDALTQAGLLVGIAVVALGSAAIARRTPVEPLPWRDLARATRDVLRDPLVAILAAVTGACLAYAAALGVLTPPNETDALVYHLPRAALWALQGHVGAIPAAPDLRLTAPPPHGEIGLLYTLVVSGDDQWAALVQLASLVALAVGVLALARRIGVDRRGAAFAALAVGGLPIVLLQSATALNDLVVASFLVAAVVFAVAPAHGLPLSALSLALAAGTKPSTYVVLPAAALAVAALVPRSRWGRTALAWIVGAALGSYWYLANLHWSGRLDGGLAETFEQIPDRSALAVVLRIYQLTANLLETPATAGRGRWAYVLAGVCLLVVALVTAARRRRPAGAPAPALALGLALAGLVVALVPWPLVAARDAFVDAARSALRAAGQDALAAGVDGPVLTGYPTPMESTFGIAAVALTVAAALLAVRAGRRRELPRAAWILATVPLVGVVGFALAFTFDEMRARFLAAPVALAAALWGLVLPRRVLAAAAVALLSASSLSALAFAAWKPSGLALLAGRAGDPTAVASVWGEPRWRVQGDSRVVDAAVSRFVETRVPASAPLALLAGEDEGIYALFDAARRRIVLVPNGSLPPPNVSWVVVTASRRAERDGLARHGWTAALETERGWTVLRRTGSAARS